ncbi:hypothetical protein ACFQZV_12455 [Microbacterium koreense]|uniref:Uncharacterized protein n=1 Tax=Microbacterium koreense TaxID=323761 RepID=A0ABW2ZU78_9MICO
MNWLKRRLGAAIDWRVEEKLAEIRGRTDRLEHELRASNEHFGADYGYMRAEFDRIAPQVAALEYRMERITRLLDGVPSKDEALQRAELEHERARLRLELVAHYEERLRRLEVPGESAV